MLVRQRQRSRNHREVLPNAAVAYAVQQFADENWKALRQDDRASLAAGHVLPALGSVAALLGLTEQDVDRLMLLELKSESYSTTGMSYTEYIHAIRSCAALHGCLALDVLPALQVPDLSHALHAAYVGYCSHSCPVPGLSCPCRLGPAAGDQPPRMHRPGFLRVATDVGLMQPEGPMPRVAVERVWAASCGLCEHGLTEYMTYGEFLRALAVLSSQLWAELFVPVAALGLALELPDMRPLPSTFSFNQWREVALNQGGKWTLPQLTAAALSGMVQQGKLYEYDSFATEASYPPAGQAASPHSNANASPTLTLPHHSSRPRTMSSDRVASPSAQRIVGYGHGMWTANGSVPGSPGAASRFGRGGVGDRGDGGGGGGGVRTSRDGSGSRDRPRSAGLMVLSPYLGRAVRSSPHDGLTVNSDGSRSPRNLLTGGPVAGGWITASGTASPSGHPMPHGRGSPYTAGSRLSGPGVLPPGCNYWSSDMPGADEADAGEYARRLTGLEQQGASVLHVLAQVQEQVAALAQQVHANCLKKRATFTFDALAGSRPDSPHALPPGHANTYHPSPSPRARLHSDGQHPDYEGALGQLEQEQVEDGFAGREVRTRSWTGAPPAKRGSTSASGEVQSLGREGSGVSAVTEAASASISLGNFPGQTSAPAGKAAQRYAAHGANSLDSTALAAMAAGGGSGRAKRFSAASDAAVSFREHSQGPSGELGMLWEHMEQLQRRLEVLEGRPHGDNGRPGGVGAWGAGGEVGLEELLARVPDSLAAAWRSGAGGKAAAGAGEGARVSDTGAAAGSSHAEDQGGEANTAQAAEGQGEEEQQNHASGSDVEQQGEEQQQQQQDELRPSPFAQQQAARFALSPMEQHSPILAIADLIRHTYDKAEAAAQQAQGAADVAAQHRSRVSRLSLELSAASQAAHAAEEQHRELLAALEDSRAQLAALQEQVATKGQVLADGEQVQAHGGKEVQAALEALRAEVRELRQQQEEAAEARRGLGEDVAVQQKRMGALAGAVEKRFSKDRAKSEVVAARLEALVREVRGHREQVAGALSMAAARLAAVRKLQPTELGGALEGRSSVTGAAGGRSSVSGVLSVEGGGTGLVERHASHSVTTVVDGAGEGLSGEGSLMAAVGLGRVGSLVAAGSLVQAGSLVPVAAVEGSPGREEEGGGPGGGTEGQGVAEAREGSGGGAPAVGAEARHVSVKDLELQQQLRRATDALQAELAHLAASSGRLSALEGAIESLTAQVGAAAAAEQDGRSLSRSSSDAGFVQVLKVGAGVGGGVGVGALPGAVTTAAAAAADRVGDGDVVVGGHQGASVTELEARLQQLLDEQKRQAAAAAQLVEGVSGAQQASAGAAAAVEEVQRSLQAMGRRVVLLGQELHTATAAVQELQRQQGPRGEQQQAEGKSTEPEQQAVDGATLAAVRLVAREVVELRDAQDKLQVLVLDMGKALVQVEEVVYSGPPGAVGNRASQGAISAVGSVGEAGPDTGAMSPVAGAQQDVAPSTPGAAGVQTPAGARAGAPWVSVGSGEEVLMPMGNTMGNTGNVHSLENSVRQALGGPEGSGEVSALQAVSQTQIDLENGASPSATLDELVRRASAHRPKTALRQSGWRDSVTLASPGRDGGDVGTEGADGGPGTAAGGGEAARAAEGGASLTDQQIAQLLRLYALLSEDMLERFSNLENALLRIARQVDYVHRELRRATEDGPLGYYEPEAAGDKAEESEEPPYRTETIYERGGQQ